LGNVCQRIANPLERVSLEHVSLERVSLERQLVKVCQRPFALRVFEKFEMFKRGWN
jgi:hypothetical protein